MTIKVRMNRRIVNFYKLLITNVRKIPERPVSHMCEAIFTRFPSRLRSFEPTSNCISLFLLLLVRWWIQSIKSRTLQSALVKVERGEGQTTSSKKCVNIAK